MAPPLKASRWLKAFEDFVADIRIQSKEELSTEEGGVKLELWESQRRFLREVGTGIDRGIHSFICLKSRQLGITTVSLAIDVFWLAMHPGIKGCLVTDDEAKKEANRQIIVSYVNSFPDGYFGDSFRVTTNNRTSITFSNGSTLKLLVAGTKKKSIGWAEGQGYAFGHLTEVSNYGDVAGLKSLEEGFAQTNPHRLYIYESTAKGYNHWRAKYYQAKEDVTSHPFFIGWWAAATNTIPRKDARFIQYGLMAPTNEEREKIAKVQREYGWKITPEQLCWIRWKEANAGSEDGLLSQNQPYTAEDAFVQSGYNFFSLRMVDRDKKVILSSPADYIFKGYRYQVDGAFFDFKLLPLDPEVDSVDDVELKIWEEPRANGKYAIGFDPAYGRNDHKDGSCIIVWRCFADKAVQVAEYRSSDVEARHAAWVAFHLCAAYADCMINVELTGPGRLVMQEFRHLKELLGAEMNQQKTADRNWTDAAANARWFLYCREDSFGSGYAANYEASYRTKQEMLHNLRGAYVSNELEIKSVRLLDEMSNVRVDGSEIGAPESSDENCKDDRVFAAGLGVLAWSKWMRSEMLSAGRTYEEEMKAESGEQTRSEVMVNSIVRRFLARADEEIIPEPTWKERMGLE